VFTSPKSIQATVTLLDRLPVILEKSSEEDVEELVLPLLFSSLDSEMAQIQVTKRCKMVLNDASRWLQCQLYR